MNYIFVLNITVCFLLHNLVFSQTQKVNYYQLDSLNKEIIKKGETNQIQIIEKIISFDFSNLQTSQNNLDKLKLILDNEKSIYDCKISEDNNFFDIHCDEKVTMEIIRSIVDNFGIDIRSYSEWLLIKNNK